MAPKTIKWALAEMLEDLSKENFAKFCSKLRDRDEEPRVRRSQVEGKSYLEITDLLVSAFTEAKALGVALEVLRDIGCDGDAANLEKATAALSSAPGPSEATRPSAGAAGGDTRTDDERFVDKHRIQLIQRVSHTEPILDELLNKGILQEESYDKIRQIPTSQDRMRALYSGCLKAGAGAKDIFYQILEENEKYLIEDLKKNN